VPGVSAHADLWAAYARRGCSASASTGPPSEKWRCAFGNLLPRQLTGKCCVPAGITARRRWIRHLPCEALCATCCFYVARAPPRRALDALKQRIRLIGPADQDESQQATGSRFWSAPIVAAHCSLWSRHSAKSYAGQGSPGTCLYAAIRQSTGMIGLRSHRVCKADCRLPWRWLGLGPARRVLPGSDRAVEHLPRPARRGQ